MLLLFCPHAMKVIDNPCNYNTKNKKPLQIHFRAMISASVKKKKKTEKIGFNA